MGLWHLQRVRNHFTFLCWIMNHFIDKIIHNIYHTFIHVLIYIHVHHLDNCYFQKKKCLHLTYILFHNYTNNKIVKQKAKLQVCPSPEYQRQFMDLTERLVFSFRISIFIVLLCNLRFMGVGSWNLQYMLPSPLKKLSSILRNTVEIAFDYQSINSFHKEYSINDQWEVNWLIKMTCKHAKKKVLMSPSSKYKVCTSYFSIQITLILKL